MPSSHKLCDFSLLVLLLAAYVAKCPVREGEHGLERWIKVQASRALGISLQLPCFTGVSY